MDYLANMNSHSISEMSGFRSDIRIWVWWVKCCINMRHSVPRYLMFIWLCPDVVKFKYSSFSIIMKHAKIWKSDWLLFIIPFLVICLLHSNHKPESETFLIVCIVLGIYSNMFLKQPTICFGALSFNQGPWPYLFQENMKSTDIQPT